MADSGFEIKGIKEFIGALKSLDENLQRRVIRQSLIVSGKPMARQMKDNLKKHRRTGTLIKAVKSASAKKGRIGKKKVLVLVGAHKARGVDFSRDGFYGRFLEVGTSRQPPRAWARPAFDSKVREQQRILARELGRRTVKEIKRSARKIIGF